MRDGGRVAIMTGVCVMEDSYHDWCVMEDSYYDWYVRDGGTVIMTGV